MGMVSARSRKRLAARLEFSSAQMAVSPIPWPLVEACGHLAEYNGKIAQGWSGEGAVFCSTLLFGPVD
jgi:hypothetical protein